MKYWKVEAKCGHVSRNKYIIKAFYVKAECGTDAAEKVRWKGRVKHHDKKAIISVQEIDENNYLMGLKRNSLDPYFHVHNSQEQKTKCIGIDFETFYEEAPMTYKKKSNARRRLIEKQLDAEWQKERSSNFYE